jgi:uncharacterized membrane protein required for colicin V production
MNHLSMDHSPVNWFDFVVVIVLLLGVSRGRKNGMSIEAMVMLQWVAIVIACAMLYRPLGDMLAHSSPMSRLFSYISVYLMLAVFVKTAFSVIKKGAGGKLVSNNLFGRAEFYLGMCAGAVRFACILIAALALLNAPLYTQQDLSASHAYQMDLYGSNFFPGLGEVQQNVFKDSFLGSQIKKYAEFLLITPTKSEVKEIQRKKDDLP